jgi:predicted dehydrogenase/threonine dehydrogenase-like Zn-dependent dehydrogenase
MKQLFISRGEVNIEEVPAPMVEPGCVLVEVHYSIISSGTETTKLEASGKSLVSRVVEKPDRVAKFIKIARQRGFKNGVDKIQEQQTSSRETGYSCSGIVVDIGQGVTNVQVGDKVACAGAGVANHAEFIRVPINLLVKVPDGCDLRTASTVALGAIALQGVRRTKPQVGEFVAVIGLGMLGQLTVQLLKVSGCRVIGIDITNHRVDIAKKLGADTALNPENVDVINTIGHITSGYGVDATIITAASKSDAIVQQAMEITRKKGRVVLVGSVGLGLNRSPFYEKELDFLISCSYGPGRYNDRYENKGVDYPFAYVRWTENRNMQEYLRLLSDGKIQVDLILEREYPLDKARQAFDELQNAFKKPLGVLLRYPVSEDVRKSYNQKTRLVFRSKPVTGKIRIAVVGAGRFAKAVHLPNLRKLSDLYHIRAIVSTTGSNAKTAAQKFSADYATTNYQDVLNDPNVDAVLICTRHNLHAQQAIQAANFGKAILLEKPMALNHEELDQLIHVLETTGTLFMVGFNRRFSPAVKLAKDIIKERQNPIMILYRMNAGYLPPDHWTQTEEGGGRIIGEACHIFDLFQFLIGSQAVQVSGSTINPQTEHILAGDNVSVTLNFKDGSLATLIYTALGSPGLNKEYMEIFSDGKVLALDDYRSLHVHGLSGVEWRDSSQDKGHLEELKVFANYINTVGEMPIAIKFLWETTSLSIKVSDFVSKDSLTLKSYNSVYSRD